jgi:hypothetical protein
MNCKYNVNSDTEFHPLNFIFHYFDAFIRRECYNNTYLKVFLIFTVAIISEINYFEEFIIQKYNTLNYS